MGNDKVAFQGIHGAYSEQAIRQHFGDGIDTHPCPGLTEMFAALQAHQVTYGLLPVENALAGAVARAYELLMDHDLRIQAEVILHVHHALLAPKGTSLADLKYVRSHPQALSQCENFLRRNNLEAVPDYDTAGSARRIANNGEKQTGAIASQLAADLYDLDVLETNIEDVSFNYTRFFVLGHDDFKEHNIKRPHWPLPAIARRRFMNAWGNLLNRNLT